MPDLYQSMSHSRWDCKYHVVFIPKYRRKAIYGEIRQGLGPICHELARQKECRIVEGHLVSDHVHMCIGFELESVRKYIREQEVSDQQGRF